MAAFFANNSCNPFTSPSDRCVVDAYVRYAVNATSAEHYKLALGFVRQHNIRLVIRNTGHDYLGRSTGPGSLAIWTHHINDIKVLDYKSSYYQGKAVKLGAGVMALDAQKVAHSRGLVIVTGDSSSVGVAGGYTQGGGHGPLASTFGLAADQVVEWDVVTSRGERLIASPNTNSDLYWALCGGGGGTYGIVLSMTVKAYADTAITSANLTFSSDGVSNEVFYDAVETFLTSVPAIGDLGATSIWLLTKGVFTVAPVTAPGVAPAQLLPFLQPTLDLLKQRNMSFSYTIQEFPSFLQGYHALNADPKITEYNLAGRLMPRNLLTDAKSRSTLMDVIRSIVDYGAVLSGTSFNVTGKAAFHNSVNPVWRTSVFNALVATPYNHTHFEENIVGQQLIRGTLLPMLEALTPGGGAYMNEADFKQPDYEQVFYGNSYDRLLSVKRRYDPDGRLYGVTTVGSEAWQADPNGRLCRA
ncbi:putative FAD binding domain-containing protein [Rosellinia necatrix]|uniref:Putative FAD binding domain-containing protein n=1 Tax=Rosellinia necatrix TaxID=77044 RepID=A0A1W2TPC9_ROSNE|nr:putative FAD binding domain-containing protein [Rosellinia necatrix]